MKKKSYIIPAITAALLVGSQTALADVAVCYYEFDSDVRTTAYSTSSFSVTRGSLTVVGWQTNDAYLRITPSVTYQVVKKGFVYDTEIGNPSTVTGNYTQSGAWFTTYLTNIPSNSGYHLRTVMNSSYNTHGAGNGY